MKLHIGNEIKRVLEEKGVQPAWVAQKINTSQRNFYDILTRESIATDQLIEISEALDYDFFSLFSKSESNTVNEPLQEYNIAKKKMNIVVELDGRDITLQEWIRRLKAINEII